MAKQEAFIPPELTDLRFSLDTRMPHDLCVTQDPNVLLQVYYPTPKGIYAPLEEPFDPANLPLMDDFSLSELAVWVDRYSGVLQQRAAYKATLSKGHIPRQSYLLRAIAY